MKLSLCTFGMGTLDVYHIDAVLAINDIHLIKKSSSLYIPIQFSNCVHADIVKSTCKFILHVNKIPVVVFPEVYNNLTIPISIKLHKKGVLFIVDAMSIIGKNGDLLKSKALYLIRKEISCCIGFVKTSENNASYYHSLLGVCKRKVKDYIDKQVYISIFEQNPQSLLSNKPIISAKDKNTDFLFSNTSILKRILTLFSSLWE